MVESLPKTIAEVDQLMTQEWYTTPDRLLNQDNPQDRRYLVQHLTSGMADSIISNVGRASYLNMPVYTTTFSCFPRLPEDVQEHIWKYALAVPVIVDYEGQDLNNKGEPISGKWRFRVNNPPSLLWVCQLSRKLALEQYPQQPDGSGKVTKLFRPESDIVHLRSLEFARRSFTKTAIALGERRGWDGADKLPNRGDTDIWSSWPRCFEDIQCIALHRRTLFTIKNRDFECIIRHFFPRLRVLIILIDDKYCIDRGIENNFNYYRSERQNARSRFRFTMECSGPFASIRNNPKYADFILDDTALHLSREEEEYDEFTRPRVIVRSCALPLSVQPRAMGKYSPRLPGLPLAQPIPQANKITQQESVNNIRRSPELEKRFKIKTEDASDDRFCDLIRASTLNLGPAKSRSSRVAPKEPEASYLTDGMAGDCFAHVTFNELKEINKKRCENFQRPSTIYTNSERSCSGAGSPGLEKDLATTGTPTSKTKEWKIPIAVAVDAMNTEVQSSDHTPKKKEKKEKKSKKKEKRREQLKGAANAPDTDSTIEEVEMEDVQDVANLLVPKSAVKDKKKKSRLHDITYTVPTMLREDDFQQLKNKSEKMQLVTEPPTVKEKKTKKKKRGADAIATVSFPEDDEGQDEIYPSTMVVSNNKRRKRCVEDNDDNAGVESVRPKKRQMSVKSGHFEVLADDELALEQTRSHSKSREKIHQVEKQHSEDHSYEQVLREVQHSNIYAAPLLGGVSPFQGELRDLKSTLVAVRGGIMDWDKPEEEKLRIAEQLDQAISRCIGVFRDLLPKI